MKEEIKITELDIANPDNIDTIIELSEKLFNEILGNNKKISNVEYLINGIVKNQSRLWFIVAKSKEEILGFATLAESCAIFAGGVYGIINELYIDQNYRSLGIGKNIISFISDFSKKRGWKRIDVAAPSDEKWNRTVKFYEDNGFKMCGKKLKLNIE